MIMICYEQAVEIVRRYGGDRHLNTEIVALEHVEGRICAEDLIAPMANQPFDNSAMDGFAVQAHELSAASNERPVALEVVGRIIAGEAAPSMTLAAGQCYEIMTGAPLPPGCDAVVPVENAERKAGQVLFWTPLVCGEHVRSVGEDFSEGALIVSAGERLELRHILPLATLGLGQIKVLCKPKVSLLTTGLEVIDDLAQALEPGQIYNASAPYLRQMLPALGADSSFCGTVADDPEVFRQKLLGMIDSQADIIVTTGAVSAGVCDFVRAGLEAMGAEILFHKVKMRPGKPVLFAQLPDGGPLFVGLPGNPVATAAGLRFFVYPLIRAMQGLPPEEPVLGVLRCGSMNKKAEFRFFLRAVSRYTDNAMCEIDILQKQQSFMVSTFVDANVWAVVPEKVTEINEGDVISCYPLLPS